MTRLLLIGDIHLSDRAPSSCTEDYLDDLFTILEHTIQLESELNVDGVVWSGDVFHQRQANRTSHRTVQRAIEIVQSYRNLWIVPGNHDLAAGDRLDSISDTQPLGVLYRAGAKLLQGWADDGSLLYGVPWQQHWTQESVVGAFRDWGTRGWSGGANHPSRALVVAHAPLFQPTTEPPWEYYPTGESRHGDDTRASWASIQGMGSCFYGHVHDRHGTYKVGDVTFCNHGAITRGSLQESELTRAIAVTTWSAEEGFTEIAVPHKPADAIFRLLEKREQQDSALALDEFLAKAGQAQIEIASIEAVMAHLRTLNLDPGVLALAEELLTQASG
jgi:DNA repair exonuclease SbcCD nuclease subunit